MHEEVESETVEEVIEEAVPMAADPFTVCRSMRDIKKLDYYVIVKKISWLQWHLVSIKER